jgi:HlyD family secretion protein
MSRRTGVVVVVIVAVVLGAILVLGGGGDRNGLEASGTVEVTESDLGFNLPGRVESVAVREGDVVTAGQVLARLDAADLVARRAAAGAQVDAARAVLAEMEAGGRPEDVAQARAAVRAASRRLEDARLDLERARRLHEGGAISREALDKAETGHTVAEAALDQAREQLSAVAAGPRPERVAAQRASVKAAEAAAREVEARLAQATVTAPFSGRVTLRHREPGETVQPGQPVLTVMDPDDRWVQIYVPEDRIGTVSIGQRAVITSDSYPQREHHGAVSYIAGEAEFTPRNVQTREERVKLVYAVRVRVLDDPDMVLKPGIPADVALVDAGTAGAAGSR